MFVCHGVSWGSPAAPKIAAFVLVSRALGPSKEDAKLAAEVWLFGV